MRCAGGLARPGCPLQFADAEVRLYRETASTRSTSCSTAPINLPRSRSGHQPTTVEPELRRARNVIRGTPACYYLVAAQVSMAQPHHERRWRPASAPSSSARPNHFKWARGDLTASSRTFVRPGGFRGRARHSRSCCSPDRPALRMLRHQPRQPLFRERTVDGSHAPRHSRHAAGTRRVRRRGEPPDPSNPAHDNARIDTFARSQSASGWSNFS